MQLPENSSWGSRGDSGTGAVPQNTRPEKTIDPLSFSSITMHLSIVSRLLRTLFNHGIYIWIHRISQAGNVAGQLLACFV